VGRPGTGAFEGEHAALILGVTPEFCEFPWPEGKPVIAADHTRSMLHRVWPGHGRPDRHAACTDWRSLPLADRSVDVVLGDGCLTLIPFPQGTAEIANELRRVIAPGGRLILRAFIDAERGDTPPNVCDQLLAGEYATFHEFRFRLLIAVQADATAGVRLGDAWEHWQSAGLDVAEVARRNDWPDEIVEKIHLWRNSEIRYAFPTLHQLREALAGAFAELHCEVPAYAFGDHCPLLTCEPLA
jgi:SAM-dependent methyltransferase